MKVIHTRCDASLLQFLFRVEEGGRNKCGSDRLKVDFFFSNFILFHSLAHNSYRCGGDGNLMEDTTSLLTSLTKQTKWQIQILEHTTFFL